MSTLSNAFIASLRRISAERRDERAEHDARREQVSVLLALQAENQATILRLRKQLDHLRTELRTLISGRTLAEVRQQEAA